MAGLDDLDLDDMFNDSGDNLFDGLDIELDGTMGDIISNDKSQIAVASAAPPPPRRAGGPRTKRTNPMLEREEMEAASSGDGDAKRRKTKRKSKAPTAYGDEDDEDYQALIELHQPKKKRKAALKAKKATAELAAANNSKAKDPTTATIKRKKKGTAATSAPATGIPTITSHTLSTSPLQKKVPNVAAAGRFGTSGMKRGSSTGTLGAGTTTKVKRKLKKSGDGSGAGGTAGGVAPGQPRIPPPKAEPTFGGLAPSKFLFYPFLDGVPLESTMQKRKAYPIMDKLSSALTSTVANSSSSSSANAAAVAAAAAAATSNATGPGGDATNGMINGGMNSNYKSTEASAIFKLMLDTYGGISDKEKAGYEEKRAALAAGMPKLRENIGDFDKTKLVSDVFSMCWLLTRQYNFLTQSLENMDNWCQEEFSEEDYQATYAPPEDEKAKAKLRKWPSVVNKVKISFGGYREPKGLPPLEAILPPFVVSAPPPASKTTSASSGSKTATGDVAASATKSKKRKSATGGVAAGAADKAKAGGAIPHHPSLVPAPPPGPKTYADSSPQARRQLILEKVSHLAMELEQVARQGPAGSSSAATSGSGPSSSSNNSRYLKPVPDEDPPLHTARMWEWLQSAGFYRPLDQLSLRRLALHRSPEINPQGLFLRTPPKILGSDERKDIAKKDSDDGGDEINVSPNSIFDRLQALLVEEVEASEDILMGGTTANGEARLNRETDDEDDVKVEEGNDDVDNESLGFLDDDDGNLNDKNVAGMASSGLDEDSEKKSLEAQPPVADLSDLTLEERTFIQLSSAGLIQKSLFPAVELVKVTPVSGDKHEEDDLVGVIGEMANDLSKVTARNNGRISFLEASAAGSNLIYNKQVEEQQASLIARCQNLLKRNKEKAKKAKQKKDDNLNLPW